jgi:hypothetical protein
MLYGAAWTGSSDTSGTGDTKHEQMINNDQQEQPRINVVVVVVVVGESTVTLSTTKLI